MMTKRAQIAILQGLNIKSVRLRALTRDHFNSGQWDTETHGKEAAALYDEIVDMATTLRREAVLVDSLTVRTYGILGERARAREADQGDRRKYQTRRGEMAFKCGHCQGRHDTVKEAQQCFQSKRREVDAPATPEPTPETEVMRPGAQKFLSDLLRQFGLVLTNDMTPETIPWQDGKKILHGLIDARRLKATSKPYSLPDGVLHDPKARNAPSRIKRPAQKLPDCPVGYYAVPDWTGKEELKFFWVKEKKGTGPYAGWTFVDQVVGGHVDHPCRGKFAIEAINAILDFGVENAGMLYATKLKHCWKCNKHLTKKASRTITMGRHCAYENGQGEEWDALNHTYNDADAED